MKVLVQESWAWTLYRDESGALYLSVLCGTVGLYFVDFRLNQEEAAQYRAAGESAVQALARNVSLRPQAYRDRHIDQFTAIAAVEGTPSIRRRGREP